MALTKVTYVDEVTPIESQNLNDIQDEIISNAENITTLQTISQNTVDYVVDQGTTNGWAYRKWESGRYECWYHQNYTVNITTQSGNVYYGTIASIDYPITFTSTPVLILTVTGDSGCWVSAENTTRTARTGTIWVYRGVSTDTVTVSLNIYIQGSWE